LSIATEISRLQQAKADLKTAINAKGQSIADEKLDDYAGFVDDITTGLPTEEKTVSAPDFSAGNVVVTPTTGYSMSQVTLVKDADLAAANIKKDTVIFGVTGTLEEGTPAQGEFEVRFIDYDGTLLKTEYVNAGGNATAPTSPSHTGLTFNSWNNAYTNVQHDVDTGAIYTTTDTYTHAFFTFNDTGLGKTITLYFNKSGSALLTVSWGDGTADFTTTTSGNLNTGAHTYANYGSYEVVISAPLATGLYFGQGSTTYRFCTTAMMRTLTHIHMGNKTFPLDYCFADANSLQKISLSFYTGWGGETPSMAQYCFQNCRSLVASIHPTAMTHSSGIWAYAFTACRNLKYVCINSTCKAVGVQAFSFCTALEKIIFPDGQTNTTLAQQVCYYCQALKKVVNLKTVTGSGTGCFNSCSALVDITLPSTLLSYNDQFFTSCVNLKSITLPSGTSTFGTSVFNNCVSLSTIDMQSITAIGTSDFYGTYMKSITIPATVSSIAATAFQEPAGYSVTLEYVILRTGTAITLSATSAFSGINPLCKIYVPDDLVATYKAATNWSTYTNYIFAISTRP